MGAYSSLIWPYTIASSTCMKRSEPVDGFLGMLEATQVTSTHRQARERAHRGWATLVVAGCHRGGALEGADGLLGATGVAQGVPQPHAGLLCECCPFHWIGGVAGRLEGIDRLVKGSAEHLSQSEDEVVRGSRLGG